MSICFDLTLDCPPERMVPLESHGPDYGSPVRSLCSFTSDRASHVVSEHAMYAASVVDMATNGCLSEYHETGPPYAWKT